MTNEVIKAPADCGRRCVSLVASASTAVCSAARCVSTSRSARTSSSSSASVLGASLRPADLAHNAFKGGHAALEFGDPCLIAFTLRQRSKTVTPLARSSKSALAPYHPGRSGHSSRFAVWRSLYFHVTRFPGFPIRAISFHWIVNSAEGILLTGSIRRLRIIKAAASSCCDSI
jgi:hypothetical protein